MAAPGLDGWRTIELQTLPLPCCDAIAPFFQRLECDELGSFPRILGRAKQVILHKAGPETPLNKRLTTVLSPLLLAYTGTRFRHLQAWQTSVLPRQICGGIKGRKRVRGVCFSSIRY